MKKTLFALALCAGLLPASAFAATWTAPINGSLSSVMLPDGAVMMKVHLAPKEYAAISGMMASKHDSCTLFRMSSGGQFDSAILICGGNREDLPNY